MKQFILKETPGRDRLVRLSGDDYHYLVRVRRLKAGDSFPVLLPERIPGTVSVLSTERGILSGRVSGNPSAARADLPSAPPAVPPIVLFQAFPKGAKIDLVVRQAAEGALNEVVVFTAERSVARPGKPEAAGKEERWRRIVKEARQQSGSAVETGIRFCSSLDAALLYWARLREKYRDAAGLLLHQDPAGPLEQGTFHDYLGSSPELAALAVGPEGGFSAAEVTGFLQAGFKAVRMGDTVLRSETAALYGAAAVRIILLEKAAWMLKKK
ncbi:MAG: 16S rRNA (uracil(1498)-N(3))-methyltransferase [Treponema sp.]|nr:16S rRNA (uracil(1498)-N(3))-methyltransferase [Treponema sp.]